MVCFNQHTLYVPCSGFVFVVTVFIGQKNGNNYGQNQGTERASMLFEADPLTKIGEEVK